jgi:hypothetical protein
LPRLISPAVAGHGQTTIRFRAAAAVSDIRARGLGPCMLRMTSHSELAARTGDRSCEKMRCHAERSEAPAFIFLKTNNCRFFASLRMTGWIDFFTPSSCGPRLFHVKGYSVQSNNQRRAADSPRRALCAMRGNWLDSLGLGLNGCQTEQLVRTSAPPDGPRLPPPRVAARTSL